MLRNGDSVCDCSLEVMKIDPNWGLDGADSWVDDIAEPASIAISLAGYERLSSTRFSLRRCAACHPKMSNFSNEGRPSGKIRIDHLR
jgi:hypothetical protein